LKRVEATSIRIQRFRDVPEADSVLENAFEVAAPELQQQ
jgi:hypothetical protein